MNIAEVFFRAASLHPERIAIIHRDRAITYAELARQVRSTAAFFRRKGLGHGDRVLVFVPMGIDLYRTVLALFMIGAGAVFLDAWVGWKRLGMCCAMARCKGLVGGRKVRALAWFSGAMRSIPVKLGTALPPDADCGIRTVDDDETALITFTTGSTGTPKAARRSHGFLAAQFRALSDEIGPTPEDVDMTTLPIVLFLNLGAGCTSVIPDFDPREPASIRADVIVEELRRHRVDRLTASPAQVVAIAQRSRSIGRPLTALRRVYTGGAPVFPRDAALMEAGFPGASVKVVFGSTECEPISSITTARLNAEHGETDKGLCVGDVFHRTALRIIRITDAPLGPLSTAALDGITLGPDAVGEIIVSGDHVLRSYLNGEEAFRRNKIVVDGTVWHRTGDSGRVDARGLLFLTGRCADLIHRGDGMLAPFVWEDRLLRYDGVVRGTILERGPVIVAVLQVVPGCDRAALRARLLAEHPLIGAVEFIRRMPLDPRHQGKIDQAALRRRMR